MQTRLPSNGRLMIRLRLKASAEVRGVSTAEALKADASETVSATVDADGLGAACRLSATSRQPSAPNALRLPPQRGGTASVAKHSLLLVLGGVALA